MQACDRCHLRKTRCDRRMPQCSSCEKVGTACLHVDKFRQRQLPRGYMDSMEKQVQDLSNENQRLRRDLAILRGQQADPGGNNIENSNSNSTATSTASYGLPNVGETANAAGYISPGRTPTGDVFTTEVCYLSLKATGETRYVGSSSGMGLASIIDSVVNSQDGIYLLPTEQKVRNGSSANVTHTASSNAKPPLLSVATPFIEAYFQHTHITFPLLHRPSFLQTVEQIYGEPTYYEAHPYEAFVFDMVLAIGCSNFNRFEESTANATTHYMRAQSKLHQVLGMKGLMPLKAIILLSQHGIFSNLQDTSASIWHLIGVGVRICFEMGLHLEPKQSNSQSRPSTQGMRHVTLEEEMRKRCFWCLYNLDKYASEKVVNIEPTDSAFHRVVSFTLGRPAALQDRDIDISLPSHLDDEAFGTDRPIVQDPAPADNPGAKISPFLHLIRIRSLSGEILGTFYSAKQGTDVSVEEKIMVRRELHKKLISWRNDTQLLNLAEKQSEECAFVSCFLTPEWYNAVFNNGLLLLYRPNPYLPHPKIRTGLGDESEDQGNLFSAAKATINAYSDLHRKRRLNYSWITLHGVFIAGLAFVYAVGQALKDSGQTMPIPDYLDIINDTRTCSNLLVAICERWNVARTSCELFNKLSSAVIRDAVNAATKRHTGFSDLGNANSQLLRNNHARAHPSAEPMGTQGLDSQQFDLSTDMGMQLNHLPPVDHMSVIDEFRQYAIAFESDFSGEQSFPSELVMGFSQDWTFDDPFSIQEDIW